MLQNTNKKNNRRTNHKKSGPGKRISKTRQARMREERLKSTFHFGVKLIILLAVVIGDVYKRQALRSSSATRMNGRKPTQTSGAHWMAEVTFTMPQQYRPGSGSRWLESLRNR